MLSLPESSTRYRALIQLLRTAEDLWNASRVFFTRWHLSPSQFNVLNLLRAHPEGLSQTRLSQLLIMHRSNATGLVDRLERRGLVQRSDNTRDRRAYQVTLTAEGNRLLQQILPHYFAAADRVWAGLPEARVEHLLEELRDLTAHAAAVAGTEAAVAEVARASQRKEASPRRDAQESRPSRSPRRSKHDKDRRPPESDNPPAAASTSAEPGLRTTDL